MSSVYASGHPIMQDLRPESPLESLLEGLQARILANPPVLAEWRAASTSFPFADDPGSLSRFLQWFLLERRSECLGSPPALVWAPDPLEEGSPWERLLGSWLGAYELQVREPDSLRVRDLASERVFHLIDAPATWVPSPDHVLIARVAAAGGEGSTTLPGAVAIQGPGIVAAMGRDFARNRGSGGSIRLSYLACEEWIRTSKGGPSGPPFPSPPVSSVQEALERFDRAKAAGWALDQRFQVLERDLGLPEGISGEGYSEERVGPPSPGSFAAFLESYTWERGAKDRPGSSSEKEVLAQFRTFLERNTLDPGDPSEWTAVQVCTFLLAAGDPRACRHRMEALQGFLTWAVEEQGAPLTDLIDRLAQGLSERLPGLVGLNHRLPSPRPGCFPAQIATTDPWRLRPPHEALQVAGLPVGARELAGPGDWLLGSREGTGKVFQVHAVLPELAMPPLPEDPHNVR